MQADWIAGGKGKVGWVVEEDKTDGPTRKCLNTRTEGGGERMR